MRAAIHRLKQEAGVIIRSQSPVMRGINDDGEIWAAKWREEVRLGVIPYYMFMARDTGAQAFFDVPLVRAQRLYAARPPPARRPRRPPLPRSPFPSPPRGAPPPSPSPPPHPLLPPSSTSYADAIRSTSGLCRTARGPSMSCTPGKVEVVGVQEILGKPAFVLRFLQCRDSEWIGKVFFAKFDDKAVWFDDLEPLDGMSLPWSEKGLPQPCIDEPCQVDWMDKVAELNAA